MLLFPLFALLVAGEFPEDPSLTNSLIQFTGKRSRKKSNEACEDYTPWVDSWGDDCANQFMYGGDCLGYDSYFRGIIDNSAGTEGLYQNEACCACGDPHGGKHVVDSLRCNAADCSNHGSGSGFRFSGCSCTCESGWEGTKCEIEIIVPCEGYADCSGHGDTSDGNNKDGCDCNCHGGWEGTACDEKRQCTADNHDCNHGTVHGNHVDGCECTCEDGWAGEFCNFATPCDPVKHCNDRGTTVDSHSHDGCDCLCDQEWFGVACEEKKPCQDNELHCHNHGDVHGNWVDGCTCTCEGGWSGPNCLTPPPCDAATHCSGNGDTTDVNSDDGCICSCHSGWTGNDCSQKRACTDPAFCNNRGTLGGNLIDGCTCSDCQKINPHYGSSKRFSGDQCEIKPECPNLDGIPASKWIAIIRHNHHHRTDGMWYFGLPESWWHGWGDVETLAELEHCADTQCPRLGGQDKNWWMTTMANNQDRTDGMWYFGLPENWWHGMGQATVEYYLSHC